MTKQTCPNCGSHDVELREYYDEGTLTDQLFECKACGETGDKYDFAQSEGDTMNLDQEMAEAAMMMCGIDPDSVEIGNAHELALFEDNIRSNSAWWNSKQGTTCECSTSYHLIQDKMEIMAKYSQDLDRGCWAAHHCSACKEHHDGKRNLHVMIWPN